MRQIAVEEKGGYDKVFGEIMGKGSFHVKGESVVDIREEVRVGLLAHHRDEQDVFVADDGEDI